MKSKNKKRILALVLSMVLMLSTGISAMAEGEAGKGTTSGKTVTDQDTAGETQDSSKEMETETAEGEKPGEIEKVTETPVQTEPAGENVTEEIVSEAADLYQEFKDEDGNVITTIHAYVPEGAFQAKADQISMEAKLLDADSENYIKGMMEEKLPENSYLGGYVLYEVNFMVDGVITEPAKAITLTIEGSGLSVKDLSRTKAFYYDPADPEVEGDEDQLTDMGQKADVLAYLAENGIAEDQINTYEYSELDIQNETAHQIGFNTWKSTIYGCYTEAYSAETAFTQEVEGVTVNVTAPEGAFPTAAENVSFTAGAVTEEQDTVIRGQLEAKAEELGQEVKGYEAFALSFTVSGEEIQPRVPVSVSFENTGLPAEDVNGAQSFRLDGENRAVNELEGAVENGTASMTLDQMGTVGYWAYGDAVIQEEDSTSPEDENTPDGTEEKQPEGSVEEAGEAVADDSQGAAEDKEEGSADGTQDAEETEEKEDNSEDTRKEDADLEADSEENKEQEEDTDNIEETGSDKEEIGKENSEDKEEAAEKDTSEDEKKESDEKGFTYEDGRVVITVSAEKEGIIPEGAELSVAPIEKTEITEDMSDEEKAEAQKINEQYSFTEEKLKEESEANEEVMEGFLAYDICFLVDGEEVEPSGDVQVTMDFKEAAIPEGVSEDAEVSVKHLKEEAAAEDGVVVEDMTEKSEVQTTEAAAVEKVELTSDSFSTFTIVWGSGGNKQILTVHHVDENGKEIEGNTEWNWRDINLDTGDNAVLENFKDDDISGYSYKGAHLNKVNGENVYSVKYSKNGGWTYKKSQNSRDQDWRTNGAKQVYLVYEKVFTPTPVETISNTTGNITMRMIDYGSAANGINIGGGYGSGNVKQGLLNPVLKNGYPYTAGRDGYSLSSLFSGGKEVDNLFVKSTYDETGYYEYSSFKNYAYLGDGNSFTVYQELGSPSDHKNDGASYYNRGNFLPYNKLEIDSGNRNRYDADGNDLSSSDDRYNETLYTSKDKTNYYFGMYMEVPFSQPKEGQVERNNEFNPMIYEFNGDDDLWVYIDDVLVLDIGGIHDAHSGYINFATGAVHVECVDTDKRDQNTTIKDMYKEAGVFPDGSEWDDKRVDEYFSGNTFKDYTTHNMKMFYMERGAGASNLNMKFNLQTVPTGEVDVTKQLTNTDKEKYANVEFAFQVLAQKITGEDEQGNETYSEKEYVTLDEAVYKDKVDASGNAVSLVFHDGVTIADKTYDNVFYLKPDETAIFSNLQKDRKYYVQEIGVNAKEYSEIIINGTTIKSFDEDDQETSKIDNIVSGTEEVGERGSVVFENSCSAYNKRELRITKKMAEGQQPSGTFTFRVQLEGTDGTMTDYIGNYYLKDAAGNYYYYDEGGKLVSNGEESRVCGETSDGQISGVPAGYTVAITGILSDTDFKVAEIDPNTGLASPLYQDPVYEVKEGTAGKIDLEEGEEGAAGTILLGKDAEVTVTNSLLDAPDTPYIEVQKTFKGLTQEQINRLTDFKIKISDSSKKLIATLTLTGGTGADENVTVSVSEPETTADGITYTWKIFNIGEGTYYVVGEDGQFLEDYEVSTIVNGIELTGEGTVEGGVDIKYPAFTVSGTDGKIPSQGTSDFTFNEINVIVISFTGQEGYLVWTEDTLSQTEREAVVNAIGGPGTGQFESSNFNMEASIVFFSTRELLINGFDYRGHIEVTEDNKLYFEGKDQWNMIWAGTYTKTPGVDAEIEVVNGYKPKEVDIDLQKYGSDYSMNQLTGAKFSLYQGTKGDGAGNITWSEEPMENYSEIEVTAENHKELKLKDGYYKLVETTAPGGYVLLEDSIYFKVEDQKVVLIDENGNNLSNNKADMWEVDGIGLVIKIKNEALYDLPSAGGSGIFLYMIGGTLLLIAGSLMIYINRRREVLRK